MKTETFYTKGKQDCNAAIEVTVHDKGAVASAERDHITRLQLRKVLQKDYPDYIWSVEANTTFGYWQAYGRIA